MLQEQYSRIVGKPRWYRLRRSQFLQRHPLLTPVMLLSGSLVLCIASFFSDTVFPVLALLGIPSALFCLSVSAMLVVVGILVGIISLIEYLDRYSAQASTFSRPKEQGYVNRN